MVHYMLVIVYTHMLVPTYAVNTLEMHYAKVGNTSVHFNYFTESLQIEFIFYKLSKTM